MSKITAAYQQFSHRVQQQPGTRNTGAAQNHKALEPKRSTDSPSRLNGQQQSQLRQLRESGTLENLQAILSEDEASLLAKLFPGDGKSYDAGAHIKSSHQRVKGGLLDTRF